MTSKYACFDIGDVLCNVSFDPFLEAISKHQNISKTDAWYFLSRAQKLHDLGLTDLKSELHDHFKIHSEVIMDEILTHWDAAVWQEEVMFEMLADLIANGVQIALLSNIGTEHATYLGHALAGLDGWKKSIHFLSCEAGCRKPSMLYYQSFLSLYPKFKGSFYFDDRQENLDTGKIFGFQTIHFALSELAGKNEQITKQNVKQAAQRIKNLILK